MNSSSSHSSRALGFSPGPHPTSPQLCGVCCGHHSGWIWGTCFSDRLEFSESRALGVLGLREGKGSQTVSEQTAVSGHYKPVTLPRTPHSGNHWRCLPVKAHHARPRRSHPLSSPTKDLTEHACSSLQSGPPPSAQLAVLCPRM